MISIHGVNEICSLLGFYAAYNGNSVPTFRYNLCVPFSGVKLSAWILMMWPIYLLTTSLRNCYSTLRKSRKEQKSYSYHSWSLNLPIVSLFLDSLQKIFFATSKAYLLQGIKYRDEYTIPKRPVVIILLLHWKKIVSLLNLQLHFHVLQVLFLKIGGVFKNT